MSGCESDSDPSPFANRQPFFPRFLFPDEEYSLSGIALRAQLLGFTTGVALCATIALYFHNSIYHLTLFFMFLSVFHFLEYFVTARYNTRRAGIGSFLFRNGAAYNVAHTVASIEYLVEWYFFPTFSPPPPSLLLLGLAITIFGQTLRSLAMVHASTNFNHHVAYRKEVDHNLVTTGVYQYVRHPSYLGFWCWGLGTQIMLVNPVCFVGYTVVLWRFFNNRIKGEEQHLIRFFGKNYIDYRDRTRTWIPFIG